MLLLTDKTTMAAYLNKGVGGGGGQGKWGGGAGLKPYRSWQSSC